MSDDISADLLKQVREFFVEAEAYERRAPYHGPTSHPPIPHCTSKLQRRFQCDYNRAAAIMDKLERDGFLTAPDNQGNRRILV